LAAKLSKVWALMLMGGQALLMGNMLMTGSRTPVIFGVIVFAGFLLGTQWWHKPEMRKAFAMLLLTGVACVVAGMYWFNDAVDAFWLRATTSGSTSERVATAFTEPLEFLYDLDVFGYGAGASHPGAGGIRARLDLPDPEVEPPEAENE